MIETEIKFAVPSLDDVLSQLSSLGDTKTPRLFERNRVFDTPTSQLRRSGQLLRLREDDGIRLTHKSPVRQPDSEAKQMEELELTLSDASAMADILEALGYTEVRIYEKYRQIIQIRSVHVCLDTLPFGHFVELEGAVPDLRDVAKQLRLSWDDRILDNYLTLYEQWCNRLARSPGDITFQQIPGDHPTYYDLMPEIRRSSMEPPLR